MIDPKPFRSQSLFVVGSINRDIKIAGLHPTPDVFQDGETSVGRIVETIGGGGANSACAAASLGATTHFAGKIGGDDQGRRLADVMERHGVRTHLARSAQFPTGTSVAIGYDTGTRHFISWLPNNESLRWEDLDLSCLPVCGHLLRADVWFSPSMLEGGNRRLLEEARRCGVPTSLDINWDPCWRTGKSGQIASRKRQIRDILPLIDLVHGNIRELTEFTDSPHLNLALRSLDQWGAGAVVVHMGKDGAGFFAGGELVVQEPAPIAKYEYATGTGDVLSVCMMLLHRGELAIAERLRTANAIVAEFMEGRRPLIPSL